MALLFFYHIIKSYFYRTLRYALAIPSCAAVDHLADRAARNGSLLEWDLDGCMSCRSILTRSSLGWNRGSLRVPRANARLCAAPLLRGHSPIAYLKAALFWSPSVSYSVLSSARTSFACQRFVPAQGRSNIAWPFSKRHLYALRHWCYQFCPPDSWNYSKNRSSSGSPRLAALKSLFGRRLGDGQGQT